MSLTHFFFSLVVAAILSFRLFSLHYSFPFFSPSYDLICRCSAVTQTPLLMCGLSLHPLCAVTRYTRPVTAQSSVCAATGKTPRSTASSVFFSKCLCQHCRNSAHCSLRLKKVPPAKARFSENSEPQFHFFLVLFCQTQGRPQLANPQTNILS